MLIALHVLTQAGIILRALLRRHRDPTSRAAWIVVVLALPVAGIVAYLLFGETSIGRRRIARMKAVVADLRPLVAGPDAADPAAHPDIAERHLPLFRAGEAISHFPPVGGNRAELMADSNAAIDAMVADIDAAADHVHLLFYIWMLDTNGRKMAEALMRAAARGVTCRAMVDDLGSRLLIKSDLWAEMGKAGVRLGRALPIGNMLWRVFNGRIDLRNHRKILVIDNAVTYCGSQNCADPEFRTKAKYAPWVDAVLRITGPVVRQNQLLFASDWMTYTDEDIRAVLSAPLPPPGPGFAAQVIATGPTSHPASVPEMFASLIYAARRELFVTTPYYVPVDALQSALCAAAKRGVATTIIFPARNDDFAVGAASRSYYADLLAAGVRIHEYLPGLLHTKSMTVDGEVTLIGSANMDRRSFDLNYENNILITDPGVTAAVRARQDSYLADSREVTAEAVAAWGWPTRLWNNALGIVGPLL